jgi:hypothetical protein
MSKKTVSSKRAVVDLFDDITKLREDGCRNISRWIAVCSRVADLSNLEDRARAVEDMSKIQVWFITNARPIEFSARDGEKLFEAGYETGLIGIMLFGAKIYANAKKRLGEKPGDKDERSGNDIILEEMVKQWLKQKKKKEPSVNRQVLLLPENRHYIDIVLDRQIDCITPQSLVNLLLED